MSQEDIDSQAQDLINKAIEENKQKEEKFLSKKPSKVPSRAISNQDIDNQLTENLLSKQNTVINKNIKRSDSLSSSDSDSSPQDISDDEKNDDLKKNRNKKRINKKLKTSMASNDSSLENLMVSEDLFIKVATLASAVICIMTTGLNIITSLLNEDKRLTLTFGYSKGNSSLSEILMNHTMIYILLIIIILFNLGLFIVVLLGNDTTLNKLIYTDLNWYFVLTQLALGFQFLITLIWEIDLWTINVCLSVSMLAILILAFYFTEIKQKKNMSTLTLIFIYIYISILFSFIAYLTLFNISCILMENFEEDKDDPTNTLSIVIKLGINGGQTILSIVLLSYYRDIFFALTSAYIESAVFIHLSTKLEGENIALLVMVVLVVFGIIITIIRYKKKTFGYEEVDVEITKDFN
jgi:hypothetical protein